MNRGFPFLNVGDSHMQVFTISSLRLQQLFSVSINLLSNSKINR